MDEIRELKELKDTIVAAYHAAFPQDTVTESKDDALKKIQIFVGKIPVLESITVEDKKELVDRGFDTALVSCQCIGLISNKLIIMVQNYAYVLSSAGSFCMF